jgi:hypothetical protein
MASKLAVLIEKLYMLPSLEGRERLFGGAAPSFGGGGGWIFLGRVSAGPVENCFTAREGIFLCYFC